jgi:hypothetical protein
MRPLWRRWLRLVGEGGRKGTGVSSGPTGTPSSKMRVPVVGRPRRWALPVVGLEGRSKEGDTKEGDRRLQRANREGRGQASPASQPAPPRRRCASPSLGSRPRRWARRVVKLVQRRIDLFGLHDRLHHSVRSFGNEVEFPPALVDDFDGRLLVVREKLPLFFGEFQCHRHRDTAATILPYSRTPTATVFHERGNEGDGERRGQASPAGQPAPPRRRCASPSLGSKMRVPVVGLQGRRPLANCPRRAGRRHGAGGVRFGKWSACSANPNSGGITRVLISIWCGGSWPPAELPKATAYADGVVDRSPSG